VKLRRISIPAFVAAVCIMAGAAECAVPDGAVALINGEAVSRADFGQALLSSLGASAIDGFVDWVLVEQEAATNDISCTSQELEARRELEMQLQMRRVFERTRMSAEEFWASEGRHGWDETALRNELGPAISDEALRIRLLAEKLLRAHVTIAEDDVQRYYESTRGERYAAAHIEVPTEKVARAIVDKLTADPEAWNEAVIQFSLDRGSVPYKGRLVPVSVGSEPGKALDGMKQGELKLYFDGQRWHVLQFISRLPAVGAPFEDVKDALKRELYCRRVESLVDTWLARLNAGATVVTNLSADPEVRGVLGAGVAAFVNGQAVPRSRFSDALVDLYGSKLIGPYIERQLIFQQARAAGAVVPEEALNERLEEIGETLFAEAAAEAGKSPTEFEASLSEGGTSPERYKKEQLKRLVSPDDVRATMLAEQMVAQDVEVSEQELELAYQDRYGERIDVRRIILDNAAKAEEVYRRALEGADFELLLRTESTEPLAWMHKGLVENVTARHPYFESVKDLSEGRISNVLERRGKYEILKVVAKHVPQQQPPPLDSVGDVIREDVRREKVALRVRAWLVKLEAEAQIEVALR